MKEEYYRWYSPYLGRSIEMLVFGHQGLPLILFPPADGRFYSCKDFQMLEAVKAPIEAGKVKIYCPDPLFDWHLGNTAISPEDRLAAFLNYERLLVKEIFHKARMDTHSPKIAMAGIADGAMMTANFGFKYPQEVANIILIDGSYSIRPYLDGFFNGTSYFNSPVDFIGGMKKRPSLEAIRLQQILLGELSKSVRQWENNNLSHLLFHLEIAYQKESIEGESSWENWNQLMGKLTEALIT